MLLRKVLASAHVNLLLGSAFSLERVAMLEHPESWFYAVERMMREGPDDNAWASALALFKADVSSAPTQRASACATSTPSAGSTLGRSA